VQCARCTRFSDQISGDKLIDLIERGPREQVGTADGVPFNSYFSGNTVQICPVGALTGAAYRFRSRPFDLVSSPGACEHCASGCALRTDHRRGKGLRRLAGADENVNEEWNCDKGRWAFTYATQPDRITSPLMRDYDTGRLVEASWTEALERAARGLGYARDGKGAAVLPGGRLTVEDAYAYAKFAREALGTADIDCRVRPHSTEEAEFLAAHVAGRYLDVTYADLESAPAVLLAGFEPEEESPIVFLRLRKGVRRNGTKVATIAPFRSPGAVKLDAALIQTVPGDEARALADYDRAALPSGSVIVVGERLATVPGGLSAAASLAAGTGAKLAWIPRRAGERGAIDAGCLPTPGSRDLTAILTAARDGELDALVVGGVDPADCPDPALALDALDNVGFLVSLELRRSPVTDRADVVFPVAAAVEKSGTFLDWEGRARPFEAVLQTSGALPDGRVLHVLADEMDVELGLPDVAAARAELRGLGSSSRPAMGSHERTDVAQPQGGEAVLASWHWLLDDGSLQDGEPFLAGTAKKGRLHLSTATAAELGAGAGDPVTVSTDRGSITLPLVIADLPDRVVWVPTRTADACIRRDLAAAPGAVVRLSAGGGTQ
jgi:NADH-quinone oxidoreductase subunit G